MDSTHSNPQKLVKPHCISRGKQEINKGSPTEDHQWTQHTQTSGNRKNRFAARQYWNSVLHLKNLENSGNSETVQITQYIGLGPPSWLIPTPRYVAHVSYLTTRKAPPEMPCSTPFVQIRRPEWLILTRG